MRRTLLLMTLGALVGSLPGIPAGLVGMWIGASIGCNAMMLVAEFTDVGFQQKPSRT